MKLLGLNGLLISSVLMVFVLSLSTGSVEVDVLNGLMDYLYSVDSPSALIIGEIRLPRTLLALIVGAALGLTGAALQGLLRNPLADPSLIGVSQGAALGAAAIFYFDVWAFMGSLATPVAGLTGAAITLMALIGLSGSISRPGIIIMAGLALSTLTGALLAVVLNFAPNPYAMQELVFWLLGSVSQRGMDHLTVLLPAFILGFIIIYSQRRLLLGLSLGEKVADSMGLRVTRGSRFIILGAALLIGSAVAVAGNIGFIGLLVPHLLRRFVNYRPDKLLIPSALFGAVLVCAADVVVRYMPPQRELKLGVLTALIGAPFFIYLVWKERQRWL